MALLFDRLDVTGRLKYVMNQSRATDFEGVQTGAIHLIGVPLDQDVSAELNFLTSHLASNVCAMAGEYEDGSQWIVTFERGPGGDASDQLYPGFARGAEGLARVLTRALQLNPRLEVLDELILTPAEMAAWYEGTFGFVVNAPEFSATTMMRSLAAEACGYPLPMLAVSLGADCAFPFADEHDCSGDFFSDVFQAWLDGEIHPGQA